LTASAGARNALGTVIWPAAIETIGGENENTIAHESNRIMNHPVAKLPN